MDKELIERLAREACVWPDFAITQAHWLHFAALVAEECLQVVDAEYKAPLQDQHWYGACAAIREGIRAKFAASGEDQDDEAAVAPWPDYAGNPIRPGDRIEHPDGNSGTVFYMLGQDNEGDTWRVRYAEGTVSRLCLQIGDKGRAIVKRR